MALTEPTLTTEAAPFDGKIAQSLGSSGGDNRPRPT